MRYDPRTQQFWDQEYLELLRVVEPSALGIYMAGAQAGTEMLPTGLSVLVDWDLFNRNAIDWLDTYGINVLKGIHGTTERSVVKIINDWVRGGKHLDVLKSQVTPYLGPERASRIATTEVTRMYAEGNIASWKASGVVGKKRWRTAADERVCPICAPLHGMAVPVDENGFTTEQFGMGLYNPPAHVNCRCGLQPVVDDDLVRQAIRRAISGP